MPKFKPDNNKRKDFVRCNEQIRIPQVRLIFGDQNLGIVSRDEALSKARAAGLDLVEVAPQARPPVCSIMDYGKYMFDKQKKEKDKKGGGAKKEKEVCFRYVINDHDLETKAGQVRAFLEEGLKVRVVVKFKGREKAHKDQGFVALEKLLTKLEDIAVIEGVPSFDGSNISARVDMKKEARDAKKDKKHDSRETERDSEPASQSPASVL